MMEAALMIALQFDLLTLSPSKIASIRNETLNRISLPSNGKSKQEKLARSNSHIYVYLLIMNDETAVTRTNLALRLANEKCHLSYFKPSFQEMLKSRRPEEREIAMRLMYELDSKKSSRWFFAFLSDKSDFVALSAAQHIEHFGDEGDLYLLMSFISYQMHEDVNRTESMRRCVSKMIARLDKSKKKP